MQQVFVAFLTTMLVCGIKSELEAAVKKVWTIADQLRLVALAMQRLADVIGTTLVDWLPAVMRPPKNAGREVRSVRNGWETRSEKIRDVGGM